MLHAYGGKQILETEDSPNKIKNISRVCGSLQRLRFFVGFFFFECHIPVTFPLPFVILTLKGYPFNLTPL